MASGGNYLAQDTIAALATQAGGAIAVIRVSGPRVKEILGTLCSLTEERLVHRQLSRVKVVDPHTHEPLDDAMAVFFAGPRSFTGEDCAELQIHGGFFLAQKVLSALWACGARQALPGEFSFRAVRNGKMQITEAEAIADLISAKNDGAVALALEKMSGTQSRLVTELAEDLRTLATMGELGIDFSDQDVEELSLRTLKKRAQQIFEKLEHFEGSYERGSRLQNGVRVAFVGLPNVGKSSFFNAILGEDRSIVSDIAGTTRDVVRETLNLPLSSGGVVTLRLEDTAGLRDTVDVVEALGIKRSFEAAKSADLVVLLVDAQSSANDLREVEEQFRRVNADGKAAARTVLGIHTKIDLLPKTVTIGSQVAPKIGGVGQWVGVSAVTQDGIKEAVECLAAMAHQKVARNTGEVLLTREDHLSAVREAKVHLVRGLEAKHEDLLAADLRQALNALVPLIGSTLPDDILGRIFSQFCIGK